MSNITPFDFEGLSVRVIDRDGAPWFVLADVCRVLGIGNPSDAAARLDDDEKATLDNTEGRPGQGAQAFLVINESGLYSLVLTSRKAAAKRFKKWVTAEVLPAIRKTGSYSTGPSDDIADMIAFTKSANATSKLIGEVRRTLGLSAAAKAARRMLNERFGVDITDDDLPEHVRQYAFPLKKKA